MRKFYKFFPLFYHVCVLFELSWSCREYRRGNGYWLELDNTRACMYTVSDHDLWVCDRREDLIGKNISSLPISKNLPKIKGGKRYFVKADNHFRYSIEHWLGVIIETFDTSGARQNGEEEARQFSEFTYLDVSNNFFRSQILWNFCDFLTIFKEVFENSSIKLKFFFNLLKFILKFFEIFSKFKLQIFFSNFF